MPDAFIYDNPDVVFMGINKIASTSSLITLGYNQKDQKKKGILGFPRYKLSYDHKRNVSFYRKMCPKHFIFAFVRNPYDRIVSYFSWGKHNNPHNFRNFEEFVKTKVSKPEFATQGDFRLQTYSIDSPKKCNFIGRFENFAEDFSKAMDMIGIEFEGMKQHRNKMKRGTYREYYTSQKLIDIVTKKFKKDIDTFGYKF
jgi:hypothetical protein